MLFTLLLVCLDNLVPSASAALETPKQALVCASSQLVSDFLGSKVGARVIGAKVRR